MPTVVPASVVADGNIKIAVVKTIADLNAPKASTEIKAATSLNVECYLTEGVKTNANVATITDDRLCLKQPLEKPGAVTYSIDEITYTYDVQNAAAVSNKAYVTLPDGFTGFLVIRYGLDVDIDWAASQVVDIWPVQMGPQVKLPGERNSVLRVQQKPFVTGPIAKDKILVA